MRAFINLRYAPAQRQKAVCQGLARHGFEIIQGFPKNEPRPQDLFLTWNRIGAGNNWARKFQTKGLPVIVMENATWGNAFAGEKWYHLGLNYHNTQGCFPVFGPERWDDLRVELKPWREDGDTIILLQRGIGSEPTRMPASFTGWARKRYPRARVRKHPGKHYDGQTLSEDLIGAKLAVTWGSGAAVKALIEGVQIRHRYRDWIAAQDNTDEGRLSMFRRLAWAQWTRDEIEAGDPFHYLLEFYRAR